MSDRRERDHRYSVSEKGRARRRRADKRYRETHIRIRIGHSGELHLGTFAVNPEQREQIRAFRAAQRKELHGRFNASIA